MIVRETATIKKRERERKVVGISEEKKEAGKNRMRMRSWWLQVFVRHRGRGG